MVAIKSLFLAVAAIATVQAQDLAPTGDAAAAQAYWEEALSASTVVSESANGARSLRIEGRAATIDPYAGRRCVARYTQPVETTKCSRNNCFRSFLNARQGSEGKHCPKNAFNVCCAWNSANPFFRYWAIELGFLSAVVPYTKNCRSDGDDSLTVLAKIDDVCSCTLNHEVKVEAGNEYLTATC